MDSPEYRSRRVTRENGIEQAELLAQPHLLTDRLDLRSVQPSDAPAIQQAAGAREIADTMISIPYPYPEGEAERYIARQLAERQEGLAVTYIIEEKMASRFCGLVEIRAIEREHSQAEMSFWTVVEVQGQGYMSEAVRAVLRYGFEDLDINRFYAYHMVRNPASGRVLEKNGFRQEGMLRQRVRKWGVFEDVALWAILRQDWRELT